MLTISSRYLILLLSFSFSLCLDGQKVIKADHIVFSGVIINAETAQPLVNVSCRYGKMITTTDVTGCFRLETTTGDTVRFTYVGFKPYEIVVPDTLLEEEYIVGIFLSPDTIRLAEAVILRRFGDVRRQNNINARNNMAGVLKDAYAPVSTMDASMNQRMMIGEFARSVEMKGHVEVGFGVGTQSFGSLEKLRLQKKFKGQKIFLDAGEIDLLKKLFYIEKKEKAAD